MAGLHGMGVSDDLAWQLTPDRVWTVAIGAAVIYVPLIERRVSAAFGQVGSALSLVGPFCGFLLGMVLLYSRAAVPFLYFQF
jgi:alginate O-acetyltransferase complex protein AlgI